MLTFVVFFGWLAAVLIFLRKGHYLFAIILALIVLYEYSESLTVQSILFLRERVEIPVYFSVFETTDIIDMSGIFYGRFLFISIIVLAYFVTIKLHKGYVKPINYQEQTMAPYNILICAVFIFGLLSIFDNSGTRMLQYYSSNDAYSSSLSVPFFFYGTFLLNFLAVLVIPCIERKNWGQLFIIVLASLPIISQIFIAGKRQFWVPEFMVIIIYLFYSQRNKINLKIWLPAIVAIATIGMGVQFKLRLEEQGDISGGSDFFSLLFIPLIEELAGVAHVGQSTWDYFIEGNQPIQYGLHWLFVLSNSIPYFKLGNMLWPQYKNEIDGLYYTLAPYGAMPIFADAIIGFGLLGIGIAGATIGSLTAIAHRKLEMYFEQDFYLSGRSVFALSLICTLSLKYRSGIGDIINITCFLFCIYWFFYLWGAILSRRHET
jgi:hypothetical protein